MQNDGKIKNIGFQESGHISRTEPTFNVIVFSSYRFFEWKLKMVHGRSWKTKRIGAGFLQTPMLDSVLRNRIQEFRFKSFKWKRNYQAIGMDDILNVRLDFALTSGDLETTSTSLRRGRSEVRREKQGIQCLRCSNEVGTIR